MDTIKMIYIDDSPDISLSKYLDKFRSDLCQLDYSDIEFNSSLTLSFDSNSFKLIP